MSSRVDNRHYAFGHVGDFWTEQLERDTSRPRARALTHLVDASSGAGDLENNLQRLLNQPRGTVENQLVRFDPKQVQQLGMDLQRRFSVQDTSGAYVVLFRRAAVPTSDFSEVQDELGETLLRGEDGQYLLVPTSTLSPGSVPLEQLMTAFAIPLPDRLEPLSIFARDRDMVCGVDFVVSGNCILVWEPPDVLFPDNTVWVRYAYQSKKHLHSYTLQVDLREPSTAIISFYRGRQGPRVFERALAEVGGLAIIQQDDVVTQVVPYADCGARYELLVGGMIDAHYPHDVLATGQVAEGTIIGGHVKVSSQADSGPGWWRALDWSAGLGMGDLGGLNVTIPDRPVWFSSVSPANTVGSNQLVQFELEGAADEVARFWAHVRAVESRTGRLLNAAVGLTSWQQQKFMNPLDFYMGFYLASRLWVVELRMLSLGGQRFRAIKEFIQREKPFGSVALVREIV